MLEHDEWEGDMDSLEEPDESGPDWRRLTMRFVALHMRRTAEGRRIMWRKDRNGNPPESRYLESRYWYGCNSLGWRQMPKSVFFSMSMCEYWEDMLENYHFAMGAAYWLSLEEARAPGIRRETISDGWQEPTIGHYWPTR